MRIALDVMGGDNAPFSNINGALSYLEESNDLTTDILLVGDEAIIKNEIDRFPTKLLIYPSNVQGEKCLDDIIRGIEYFNIKKDNSVDVIIIARGGGSLEDLMPFNEELLVKKIFESKIPIVSAVGHETDYTLCDLVSN